MKNLRSLSISDLWAIIQHLREEIEYWEKEVNDESLSKGDMEYCNEILQARKFFLEQVEEIFNEKVYSYDT